MQLNNYKITFKGEISSGFNLEKVKQDTAELFKLNEQQLQKIFSGTKVTLKQDITHQQAQKIQDKLQSLGLVVYLQEDVMAYGVVETVPEDLRAASQVYKAPKVRESSSHHAKNNNAVADPPSFWGFDFSGRYGRLNLVNVFLIATLLFLLSLLIVLMTPKLGKGCVIVACVIYVILILRMLVFRLHDLNKSGLWIFLAFIPIINLLFFLMPGTSGGNQYGPVPSRGSLAGLIVLLVSPVLFGVLFNQVPAKFQDYYSMRLATRVFQNMSVHQVEVDNALKAGKIPIIGSETSDEDKYYPIGMARGDVRLSSSELAKLPIFAVVGLDNKDNDIKIHATFNDKIDKFAGVTMSLQRQKSGAWNCIIYPNKQDKFKKEYLPEGCVIGVNTPAK